MARHKTQRLKLNSHCCCQLQMQSNAIIYIYIHSIYTYIYSNPKKTEKSTRTKIEAYLGLLQSRDHHICVHIIHLYCIQTQLDIFVFNKFAQHLYFRFERTAATIITIHRRGKREESSKNGYIYINSECKTNHTSFTTEFDFCLLLAAITPCICICTRDQFVCLPLLAWKVNSSGDLDIRVIQKLIDSAKTGFSVLQILWHIPWASQVLCNLLPMHVHNLSTSPMYTHLCLCA